MASFPVVIQRSAAGLAMGLVFFGSAPAASASPTPAAPATTGAGAAARPSMSPSAPIAPKPSAPRAGGNAGNLSTSLLRAPSTQALQAPTAQNAAGVDALDRIPLDRTYTAPGSRLGQF